MSAWYVGRESLSMLTDMICRYGAAGFNAFGYDFPSELMDCFRGPDGWMRDDEIFAILRQMNVDALKERYDDYEEMIDDLGYKEGYDIWEPRENGTKQWHYQFLKSLQCYEYQCSEGKVPERELYRGIDRLIVRLGLFIASNQPEYEKAEWK